MDMKDNDLGRSLRDGPSSTTEPKVSALRASVPSAMSHDAAIDALCGCAATVTVLSYQEAIEGYFTLRGLEIPQ